MNNAIGYEPARRRDAVRLAAGADVAVEERGVGACDRDVAGVRG